MPILARKDVMPVRGTDAGRWAKRIRNGLASHGDWGDASYGIERDAVRSAKGTAIGDLWEFKDGSIMMSNELYEAAVARGDFKWIAEMNIG